MKKTVILNPTTKTIKESIATTSSQILIAVPFISNFAKKIFLDCNLDDIIDKKLITRFDDSNLNSFELSTLNYLIDVGFEIRYLNEIHLKTYLFDTQGFVTSANLTKGGFEGNIELTTILDSDSLNEAKSIFNDLWKKCLPNKITRELIESNYTKYELLKKRDNYKKKKKTQLLSEGQHSSGISDLHSIIDLLFSAKEDYSETINKSYQANKERNKLINLISTGFNREQFYVPKGNPNRQNTLHYQIVHGAESKVSGSGLREGHFESVSKDRKLENLIAFIYPPSIKQRDWNLSNDEEFREYCNGIFEFEIPQYSTTMPIRLASYFYPEYFIPIFRIDQLEGICEILGFKTKNESKGDKLFEYNKFLLDRMESIPYDNYVKMEIAYQLYFVLQLKNGYAKGLSFNEIEKQHEQKWKKIFLAKGRELIKQKSSG